jgi:hypothetical protein
MDDNLGLVQGGATHRSAVRRVLLHSIDQIFRPPDANGPPRRKGPSSLKKLLKEDAYWETRKNILGWILDTVV